MPRKVVSIAGPNQSAPARLEPLLVPVAEAARLLSLDPSTVRTLARKGQLAYRKIAPTKWLITSKSIRDFAIVKTA